MKKVVFLDRDGVINAFPGNGNYVTKVKDFHFVPGALEALRILKENGVTVFVISNQAGVGKGVYSEKKLKHINRNMLRDVRKAGGNIKKVFYCIHKSNAGCSCRKPQIGHIEKALKLINKPVSFAKNAYFIGDTESDIQTGYNAKSKSIFALSGREDKRHMRSWKVKPNYIAKDLLEATKKIILKKSK